MRSLTGAAARVPRGAGGEAAGYDMNHLVYL